VTLKKKIKVTIDGQEVFAEDGLSILDASQIHENTYSKPLYHKDLKIAGNCRICLVELENSKQLVASWCTPLEEGMIISTNSLHVRTARK